LICWYLGRDFTELIGVGVASRNEVVQRTFQITHRIQFDPLSYKALSELVLIKKKKRATLFKSKTTKKTDGSNIMKRALRFFLVQVALISSLSVGANPKVEVRRKPGPSAGFPSYQARTGPNVGRPPAIRDSLGNRVTQDHMNRVEFAHGREEKFMRPSPHATEAVSLGRAHYATVYRHELEHKSAFIDVSLHRYNTILVEHPLIIGAWRTHAFFGGFYWGFHPVIAIDAYFYNPLVYWFYVGSFNENYYRTWYKGEYDAYPELHQPFAQPGLYYPTENLRQLLFGVSAMPVENQVHFRQAISLFTGKIAQSLANHLNLRVTLSKGDIVVTHYEILGVDEGIVLEGFMTNNGATYDFKGLLDLRSPPNTSVFAPVAMDVAPTETQAKTLDEMNAQISALKGEQVTAVPEAAPPVAEPAGEITAEPQAK
jgi:hypothetical protein